MQKYDIIKGITMKKNIILISIAIIIISIVGINYMAYQKQYEESVKYNLEFEKNFQKEIYGIDLTTVINRVINNNEKNNVEIGQDKKYINNNIDSIRIDIMMKDTNEVYPMEIIYNGGIEQFVQYYSSIKFKCTKIEYHKKTGKVCYLYFEQISE